MDRVRCLYFAVAITLACLVLVVQRPEHVRAAEPSGPWGMIVWLDITAPAGKFECTGFMIGPHTVGTAGHCLYNNSFPGWATSISVTPGIDGLNAPFATVTAASFTVAPGWEQQQDARTDFGAVTLPNDDLGNATGWFGLQSLADNELPTGKYMTAGYRGDRPNATMWALQSPRLLTASDASFVYYNWHITHGQSGSPIWMRTSSGYSVVGIVRGSLLKSNGTALTDVGVRVTPAVQDAYQTWTAQPAPIEVSPVPAIVFSVAPGQVTSVEQRPCGSSACSAGTAVALQSSVGGTYWTTVSSNTVDTRGRAIFGVMPTCTQFYRLVVYGVGTLPLGQGVVAQTATLTPADSAPAANSAASGLSTPGTFDATPAGPTVNQ